MKRMRNVLVLLGIGVLVWGLYSWQQTDDESKPVQRTFTPVQFVERATLVDSLYKPGLVYVWGGDVYVADYGDRMLKRFSLDGTFKNTIGKGLGQGPGEFMTFVGFVVDSSGVWVVDINSRRLTQFAHDGTYVQSSVLSFAPYRITKRDSLVVVSNASFPMEGHHVYVFTPSGQVLYTFGDEMYEYVEDPMVLSAELFTTPTGYALLATYGSYLFEYGADRGALLRTLRLVDQREFPKGRRAKNEAGETVMKAPRTSLVYVDGFATPEYWYVHTRMHAGKVKGRPVELSVIDRYKYATGEYVDSFKLPIRKANGVFITDNTLVALGDTTVHIYDIKMGEQLAAITNEQIRQ